ncbi:MAG: sortase [Solirubrobacteraceae bacterium]|nr:sortase [Solirubrobacteraceae bacterium]
MLKAVAVLLAVAGVLALADGVTTLVWQEPISGLLARFDQTRLAQSLKRLEGARATPADVRALAGLSTDSERMAFFARQLQQTARAGQAVGRIRIPRIGANFVVVAGTDESSLKKGPGIYSGTAVPGLRGTVGIAGHRTTYLAPFRRINELAPGDRITLEMTYGLFSYTVLGHRIVSPGDVSVLQQAPYDQIVLTACNPLYSAAQRIVVFARLTAAAPAGLALSALGPLAPAPLLSAGLAAGALLGEDVPADLAPSPPPQVAPANVLLGDAGALAPPAPTRAHAPAPAHRAARRAPARRAPAAGRARAPRSATTPGPVSRPVVRRPVAVAPSRPRVAPRPPARPIVRAPAPPAARRPAAVKPAPVTAPPVTAPQTRVQGSPGGPTPIIDVPSG